MTTPKPGSPVRGSATGRPFMVMLDLLGRRWSMRILWELSQRPCTFRELQSCGDQISSSVLNTRLNELREAKLVELGDDGYLLTQAGLELMQVIAPLRTWTNKWGDSLGA